jgi:hypothetical protein
MENPFVAELKLLALRVPCKWVMRLHPEAVFDLYVWKEVVEIA